MSKIDFVIRWVDDNDPAWQKEKNKYLKMEEGRKENLLLVETSNTRSEVRYRDWGLLKYWFRGIEKNAAWCNKIYFVSCGQKPDWLNTDHPKLQMVNHKDFIPAKWLPTFSSRTIDLNLFRIKDLSEQFVLFDDDMFLVDKTTEHDFFINGLPCDSMVFNVITATARDVINTNVFNNNKHFQKNDFSKKDALYFLYNLKYGSYLYKNIVLAPWKNYLGFQDFHIPEGLLKSTFRELWNNETEILSNTCNHKFRKPSDITQWLIRYWQLVSKRFVPRSPKVGQYFQLSDNNQLIIDAITKRKTKLLCINDGEVTNFLEEKQKLKVAFETIFPEKSCFEK